MMTLVFERQKLHQPFSVPGYFCTGKHPEELTSTQDLEKKNTRENKQPETDIWSLFSLLTK